MGQRDLDPDALAELIGHIYEAAVDPAHWDAFVGALEQWFPGSRITLFGRAKGKGTNPEMRFARNFADDDLKAYVDYFVHRSPYAQRGWSLPPAQPCHYEVLIQDGELFKTELYNDYYRPRGLGHYGTGVVVERRQDYGTALSLADHKNDEDRRALQLRLLRVLTPHLVRAFRVRRAMTVQKAGGSASQAAFNRWLHAAFVLDAEGRVMQFNLAAESLLQRADGLALGRDGQLRSADEAVTRALGAVVLSAAATNGTPGAAPAAAGGDSVVLPRPSGAAPLRAMASPLPFLGGANPEFGPGAVLLVIADPDRVGQSSVGWMVRQFGLTPDEQRLTEALVAGATLAQAAERLGVQISTARTRLKSIQAKTQCHRQADLIRLALSVPPIRAD